MQLTLSEKKELIKEIRQLIRYGVLRGTNYPMLMTLCRKENVAPTLVKWWEEIEAEENP